MTLNEHFERFIDERIHFVSEETLRNYRFYFFRYIAPYWGELRIEMIQRKDVVEQFHFWTQNGAPVREIRKYFSSIWGDLPKKPTYGLRLPRLIPRYNLLSQKEIQTALQMGMEHRYYLVFLTLALTGIRPAELRGLQWDDIDFIQGTLYIQRIYNRGCIGPTKTDDSVRSIAIPCRLLRRLEEQKKQAEGKWVFTTWKGTPISASSTVRAWLQNFFADIGIRYVNPYSLRHYFVISLIDHNIPISTVQRYCGWSNADMVLYYAARQSRKGQDAACALLDSDDF